MDNDFEKLKVKWELHYITLDALRKWVEINEKLPSRGITKEQFFEITGIPYDE